MNVNRSTLRTTFGRVLITLSALGGSALSARASDLVVSDVDASSVAFDCRTAAGAGTVEVTVENVGGTPTGSGFDVLLFEDQNGNGTYDNGLDLFLGQANVPGSLNPGDQATVNPSIGATFLFSKSLIYAFADSDNDIAESDETNNLANSGASCFFAPPPGQFNPVIEWSWTESLTTPDAVNVMMTPAVCDLNGDGIPEVIFASTASIGGGYVEVGYLRALNGNNGTELFVVTDPAHLVNTASSVAVGDIDLDGRPEIIACAANGTQIMAFEHDGSFKWISPPLEPINWGAPSIADIDQDGTPEIVIGRQVLNNDGSLRWTGAAGNGGGVVGPISCVADIDADGSPDIIAGNTAYDVSGGVKWQNANVVDGLDAVANFDGDPYGEVVVVGNGAVWLLDEDGTIIWGPVAIPGGGNGGPPTVADYDGDGLPEIGVAGAADYVVLESDGTIKWIAPTQDGSSNRTGSSVFDFDGDGVAEVVYRDEIYLRVYRGTDGTVLYQTPMSSCTWYEYVLVADVDADGNAEIVAVANNNCGYGPQRGVFVLGDQNDTWVSTRKIWNEHAYHITNVNEDGTIPQFESTNWQFPPLGPYNNYRQNTLPGRQPLAAPNLTASLVRVDTAPCPDGVGLLARIGNAGSNVAAAPVNVAFYDGEPGNGGLLLGVVPTTINLQPGGYEDVTLIVSPPTGPHTIWAVGDDGGNGIGSVSECDETDNACTLDLLEDPCGTTPILLEDASVVQRGGAVELEWSITRDASVDSYDLLRRIDGVSDFEVLTHLLADGSGMQSYRDATVLPGNTYAYRIDARALNGDRMTLGTWSVQVKGSTLPAILGTVPNPTRDAVAIQFSLPSARDVRLSILDTGGRVVRTYEAPGMLAGAHEIRWDLRDSNGRRIGPGVYPYRLETGDSKLTGKITIIK
jgi:hypothetical protein